MSLGGQRGSRPDLKELSGWEMWTRRACGGGAGRLFSLTAFLPGSLETVQRPREVSTGPRPSQRQPGRNGEPDLIDPHGLAFDYLRETDALHLTKEERDRRLRKRKPWGQAVGERESF